MQASLKYYLGFGYPAASAVLCIIGTLANSASLVYFIKKEEKSIGDKLLMLLNSIDLLLCIAATTITGYFSYGYFSYGDHNASGIVQLTSCVFLILYIILVDGTAYATCLLSVTRGIGIAFPFYRIKGRFLVKVGIIVFVIMELSVPIISSVVALSQGHDDQKIVSAARNGYLINRIVMAPLIILIVNQ